MNDNLPDINFKEKKEKKGGALGWLRGKFGAGSRGAMGEAGINPSAMNLGRGALGAGKFGASSGGLAGLLAGKAGMIATVAMVAVASGVYLANNAPAPSTNSAAFNSGKTTDNYVPAILRSQAQNSGSSLDMFKETNKGAGLGMEAAEKQPPKAGDAKPADAAADAQAQDPSADPGAGAGGMAQDMMGKLQGGSMGSLTSQLGGGSSKFSGMGGFNNKFGSGATGGKPGFSSGIGAGFSSMPKFDSRKGKMLAMKGSARPVFSGAKAGGKKGALAPGAFGQAKGMKAMQQSYSGTSADSARSTQDKAWEGSTAEGTTGGGAGISDGGAGIMTSPSIDNTGGSGGGGGTGTPAEPNIPEVTTPTNVSPWQGLLDSILSMLMLAAALAALGSMLVKVANAMTGGVFVSIAAQVIRILGYAMCAAAMVMGAMVIIKSYALMTEFSQGGLGAVYMIGGVCAITAGGMGMAGAFGMVAMFNPLWMCAATAAIGLIGSMLGK